MLGRSFLVAVGVAAAAWATPQTASGLRPIIHSRSTEILHLSDVPSERVAAVRAAHGLGPEDPMPTIGLKYDSTEFFWIELWRTNRETCIVSGDQWFAVSEDELLAQTGIAADALAVPWTHYVPPGVPVLFLGAAVVIPFVMRREKRDKTRAAELRRDVRYREAIEIVRKSKKLTSSGRFDEGVAALVTAGIASDQARKNLAMLCDVGGDILDIGV